MVSIRTIDKNDTQEVLEIYAYYVRNTAITFDYDVPNTSEFIKKIATITRDYPWLVCVENEKIIGYAYGSIHRTKMAYQWSPESTIYLANGTYRKGLGRVLYETLFSLLKLQGYVNVYAGVTIPNINSEEFHKALGFNEIGVFHRAGYKLQKWHDTKWFELHLAEHVSHAEAPKKLKEVINSDTFKTILQNANNLLNPS